MKKIKLMPEQVLLTLLLITVCFTAIAQKLPTEQKISLRAPANIKIDGKATEWDNKFQAYNNHVEFFYTMSNDDNNLYLTIQARQPEIIRHILNGGITLTINQSGKKNDKEGMHITYPLLQGFTVQYKNAPKIVTGDNATVIQADSFVNATNKSMNDKSKEIKVSGIKNVDTLISVYNTDGINAAALFDNKMAYTYELSIALKSLELSINTPVKFAYQLKINEIASQGINIPNANAGSDRLGSLARMTGISVGPGLVMGQSATDFWGEYILIK